MNLQGKPPIWVGFHSLYAGLHIGFPLFFVFHKTWLQKTIFGLNAIILRQILAEINHFQFITCLQHTRLQITAFKSRFGGYCHPIKVVGQRSRAVSFDGNLLPCLLLQFRHEGLTHKEGWLTTRQDDQRSHWILIYFIHNLLR